MTDEKDPVPQPAPPRQDQEKAPTPPPAPPSVVKEFGISFGRPIQVDEHGRVAKRVYEQGFRHYLVERDDGGISIFTLVDDPNIGQYPVIDDEIRKWEELNDKTDQNDKMHRVRARNNYFVLREAFPTGAAWLQDAFQFKTRERIDIDLNRAKPIYMSLLRQVRNAKLQQLDMAAGQAIGEDDKIKSVVAQKTILR